MLKVQIENAERMFRRLGRKYALDFPCEYNQPLQGLVVRAHGAPLFFLTSIEEVREAYTELSQALRYAQDRDEIEQQLDLLAR